MENLEHKLTADDLIVEYMMYKVINGYEPNFLTSEFMDFLQYFENKMTVGDLLYEKEKLFVRFFERKIKKDWSSQPHMDMIYSQKDYDYLIKANYKLSDYDRSVINTYFMDNGMGKYEDFKGQTFKVRNIIGEYLTGQIKRQIDEKVKVDKNELEIGQYISALIITNIWESYINKLIEYNEWPKQCTDINKYLFDMDLAKIINIKSIKDKLIEVYNEFSKRIAILYHQDKNLQISTHTNRYLARANYDLIIQGYEKLMNTTYGCYKKSFDVNLTNLMYEENNMVNDIYDFDDDSQIKITTKKINNKDLKKLVRSLKKL